MIGIALVLHEELVVRAWGNLIFVFHKIDDFFLHVWKSKHVFIVYLVEEVALQIILAIKCCWS